MCGHSIFLLVSRFHSIELTPALGGQGLQAWEERPAPPPGWACTLCGGRPLSTALASLGGSAGRTGREGASTAPHSKFQEVRPQRPPSGLCPWAWPWSGPATGLPPHPVQHLHTSCPPPVPLRRPERAGDRGSTEFGQLRDNPMAPEQGTAREAEERGPIPSLLRGDPGAQRKPCFRATGKETGTGKRGVRPRVCLEMKSSFLSFPDSIKHSGRDGK